MRSCITSVITLRRMDPPLVHILTIAHFLPARVPQVSLDLLRSSYGVLRGSHLGTCLRSRKSRCIKMAYKWLACTKAGGQAQAHTWQASPLFSP